MKRQSVPFIKLSLPWNWPLLAQYLLALLVVGTAILCRWLLDDNLGDRIPFLLLFGALLPLVQLVRPLPFCIAALFGWLTSVYLFQPVRMSFVFGSSIEAITGYIFALIFMLTSFTAWLTHRTRSRHEEDQAALADAEKLRAHLAAIVASSHDAIISKTLTGVITSWNRSAERLFGYSADEAIGQSIVMLLPEEHVSDEAKILDRLRGGERVDDFETVRRRKDGSLIEVAVTVSPVRSSAGEIIGASKIARDITARKEVEHELLEADRRKDEFLATLAHELRNPLAAISLAMHVLDSASNDPDLVIEMSALIQRQAAQLKRLIDDLMDAGRIAQGKVKLDLHPTELNTVLQQIIEDAEAMCEEHGLTLIVELPDPKLAPVLVRADPPRLVQVLNNLLHNAYKFTAQGGSIGVVLKSTGSCIDISITDTGTGIPEEHLQHIFEMFTQLEHTDSKFEGGLGIGLSLARSIIEMHGGTLEARSEGPNCGSEFVIRLPRLEPAQRPPTQAQVPRTATASVSQRIVAADDNVDALNAMSAMLRMKGHQVQTAENGLEAIELIRLIKPDVALLDIGMLGIDGYEVARQIRKEAWGQKMRVIAMTGWGQERDKQRAYDAGFDLHLTKPVNFVQLQTYIAENS